MNKCKKVIPFDECYTTSVGNLPSDINPDSICGQYLSKNPIQDMQTLINNANLQPAKNKSKYQNKECYTSGKLVQNGNDLLLAFAKLDKDGLGCLTREEYLDSLSVLWTKRCVYTCIGFRSNSYKWHIILTARIIRYDNLLI